MASKCGMRSVCAGPYVQAVLRGYGYWRTAAVPFEKKLYVNGTTYFF